MSYDKKQCYGCHKEIFTADKIPMCEDCLRAAKVREDRGREFKPFGV